MNVGILGLGVYLPEEIRPNSWWPESVVKGWLAEASAPKRSRETGLTAGEHKILDAMDASASDPFAGGKERRIMPKGMTTSDMEVRAAKNALVAAGVNATDLNAVIEQTTLPDYFGNSNVCVVHRELGVQSNALSMSTEGVCVSFLNHLATASALVANGANRALIVQSSGMSQMLRTEDQFSTWFGDGAAAAVIGPVRDGYGLLAQEHFTDGTLYASLVFGDKGRRWHEEGRRSAWYLENPALSRKMMMIIPDTAKMLLDRCMEKAGVLREEVKFLACHQAVSWLPELIRDHVGFTKAKTLTTYDWTTSITGANLGLILHCAQREGMIKEGDVVAMFSGAAGVTCSAALLRWGV